MTCTFFVLGWIADKYPALLAEIVSRGHTIACHSHMHQLVYTQSEIEFERDLEFALDAIEKACRIRPIAYRAPGFSITDNCEWAFDILAKQGIEIDCSIFYAERAHGGIKGLSVTKPSILNLKHGYLKVFPVNVKNVLFRRTIYSGGGYFRLFPYVLLDYWFRNDDYVMTYFHPRDFDASQPVVPGLSLARKFKSYYGLKHTEQKLKSLLSEYEFIDLFEADKRVIWDDVNVYALAKV